MRKIFYFTLIFAFAVISACKKDKPADNGGDNDNPPPGGSTIEKVRDSVFLYAKEAYLWNDALPNYKTFNPRSFSEGDDLTSLTKEVDKISQYKKNPATNLPYENSLTSPGEAKYSFIDEGDVQGELGGSGGDFGFGLHYYNINNVVSLRVTYVYPGSSAANSGLHHGEQILQVNTLTSDSFNTESEFDFVVRALKGSTINLKLRRYDGTTYTTTVSTTPYTINPVITYKTINANGGRKVGYILYNSFTVINNSKSKLDAAFNSFIANGITDLVVDLRYNGGGSVQTSEYLANLIAPASVGTGTGGRLMYNTYFNSLLTAGKASILKNQVRKDDQGRLYNYGQLDYSVAGNKTQFDKQGTLNIGRVFFIVTGSSASASELTINNLRPVMDVKLIGQKSYGKPVGFFAININKYQLYVPEFETKNAADQGGYYLGMQPGSADYPGVSDADDVTKDLGDPDERLLKQAINYVNSGGFLTSSSNGLSINSVGGSQQGRQAVREISTGHIRQFNGMVFDKKVKIK